ncbi:Acyl carrier protein [Pseudodesulfovibrio hydrargyri]|uniref:Acyl carrier protein n=1 Tax=Pseudodesulfovibrio hydrargyri TaxID=2125990 RepID=A0A1J5MSM8_9BACT|nr:phosphopantetheine-binding protein [Pseudodesulfovibrio hydrargyri]OIQ49605.1 Acyl carrier protein [Pseudodesulfovibrio hydrargyri]
MERKEIFNIIREELAGEAALEWEAISPEAELAGELLTESLERFKYLMVLEERFNIEVKEEDAEAWRTINDVIDYLEQHVP